jgi:hypothetical protein
VTLLLFRSYERDARKLQKSILDLGFLTACKAYNVFPKFLSFKLYRESLRSTGFYRSWQGQLLDLEIELKNKHIDDLKISVKANLASLKDHVSFLDSLCLQHFVHLNNNKMSKSVKITHEKKLSHLGASLKFNSCSPDKVIFNLSDYILSDREKFLLSFGLDFALPIFKPNFYRHHLSFERLALFLKNESVRAGNNFKTVCETIKRISHSLYYGFNKSKVFSPIFKLSDINILKTLKKNDNIIICKPDKGKGVVLMNKADYIFKMNTILQDKTKFKEITNNTVFKQSLKHEDKINRCLKKLFDKGVFNKDDYTKLHASGSGPGILYGLPKIHKSSVPLRPIIAAYNTPSFNLAKFLVPILEDLTINEFSVKNSYSLYDDLRKLDIPVNSFLTSFDVTSLFTNIPLEETVDIVCNKIFDGHDSFMSMTKCEFKSLLTLAARESFFLFNNTPYLQLDGLSMGSPLAPTLANIFMSHHEQLWLNKCPDHFKPFYYRRYVDDTFLIFNDRDHSTKFLEYLNQQHPNIEFTMETESDGFLPFLDLGVAVESGKITTEIFRKKTFSGLGISFFSYAPLKYKVNAIKTLLHRAYYLSSSFLNFSNEIEFLRNFFIENGFPFNLFDNQCKKFLDLIYQPNAVTTNVPQRKVYFSLPYYGKPSEKEYNLLSQLLSEYYPQFLFNFALNNPFTIGSIFSYKDRVPDVLRSNIIYKFTCESCNASYVGSTQQNMFVRVNQHRGFSHRTDRPLNTLMHSVPRNHAEDQNHPLKVSNFSIINSTSNSNDLFILESLHIHKDKPNLINIKQSATPLYITS